MAVTACVIFGTTRVPLKSAAEAITVVPAGYLVFEIEGDPVPVSVTLDNRATPLVRNDPPTRGHFVLDAHRSVGFHRLTVATQEFVFGTEDAKLQYAGILDILELIEHEGLGPCCAANSSVRCSNRILRVL